MLDLVTGYDCNVKCDYCTITDEMRCRSLSTEDIVSALEQGRRRGHEHVRFGGGEPTIRPDLIKLVRASRTLGYPDIEIQSNGLRYAHAAYTKALVDAGVNRFSISVMSDDAELYEKVVGFPKARELVLAGIRHLVRHDVDIVADVIMKHDTYRRLPSLVGFYAERGVPAFVLWLVSLSDRNADFPESLVPVREMYPFIKSAIEEGKRHGVSVMSRHIPLCMLPGLEEHLVDTTNEDVTIVTPDETFDLRDSAISANSYGENCERCSQRPRCAGIRQDYLKAMGDEELLPL